MFVSFHFSQLDKPLDSSANLTAREGRLLHAASNHDLKLLRTQGLVRNWMEPTVTVYRFLSVSNHAWCDFVFETAGIVTVLMLFIEPAFQGSFFNLKNFLIARVAATLFTFGVTRISGVAACNTHAVRQSQDWRAKPAKYGKGTKLMRLYELLGFAVDTKTGDAVLQAPSAMNS